GRRLYIAITRGRPAGLDAEQDKPALPGRRQTGRDRGTEGGRITDEVIDRQQKHDGLGIVDARCERRDGGGRRGITANRLENGLDTRKPRRAELFGDNEAVLR